jgi:uncharacterized protein (DUF58 family)
MTLRSVRTAVVDGWGALTARGRGFVSAGLSALAASVALGLDDLARIGVLLLALPLVSTTLLTRRPPRLGLSRTVSPRTLTVGQPAQVDLRLSNEEGRPGGVLLLEERVPYALGSRQRFVIDRARGQWERTVRYTVRSEVRGRHVLGPMSVRSADPFGLVERRRSFVSTTPIVVTPRVEALPVIPLAGSWTGSGDNRPRAFAGGSAEDVTIREYRRGDDLRRVHWRSTARTGELMVRREEQPWQSRATVFVDNRRSSHAGSGPASSFERAVSVAASVVVHLTARGFRVRLVTAEGTQDASAWHEHGVVRSEAGPLLEALAVLDPVDRLRLEAPWAQGHQSGGLVVAVLGEGRPSDAGVLRRMRHSAGLALAVRLDSAAWERTPRADGAEGRGDRPTVAWLHTQGWQAVDLGPRDSLPEQWTQLGRRRTTARLAEPTAAQEVGR